MRIAQAHSEYLYTLGAWEQAKLEYAAGTGTYHRVYFTYQEMLRAKAEYDKLVPAGGRELKLRRF